MFIYFLFIIYLLLFIYYLSFIYLSSQPNTRKWLVQRVRGGGDNIGKKTYKRAHKELQCTREKRPQATGGFARLSIRRKIVPQLFEDYSLVRLSSVILSSVSLKNSHMLLEKSCNSVTYSDTWSICLMILISDVGWVVDLILGIVQ